MRCKFCGSESLHNDTQRKNFSGGKAVAGAVTFGVVGAAAGLIGKDVKGYRCGACGAFSENSMDIITESQINTAISDAENGNRILFDYYKNQYPNIQANIPAPEVDSPASKSEPDATEPHVIQKNSRVDELDCSDGEVLKYCYFYGKKKKDCPVFVEYVFIKTVNGKDELQLKIRSATKKTLRSVYLTVKAFDDTGDLLSTVKFVYQNISAKAGDYLPEDKRVNLNTDLSYRIEINCDKVSFEDGEVWRDNDSEEYKVIEPKCINIDNFPRFKYILLNLGYKIWDYKDTLSLPVVHKKYWQCVCGLPVNIGEECPYCKAGVEKVLSAVSQKSLIEKEKEIIKEFAAEEAEESVQLYEEAVEAENNKIFLKAVELYKNGTSDSLKQALDTFNSIKDYKDSLDYINKLPDKIKKTEKEEEKARIEEKKLAEEKRKEEEERARIAKEEAERKSKNRKILFSSVSSVLALVLFVVLLFTNIIPQIQYNSAKDLFEQKKYQEAYTAFSKLGSFNNSYEMKQKAMYQVAIDKIKKGEYSNALKLKNKLSKKMWSDITGKISEIAAHLSLEGYDGVADKKYKRASQKNKKSADIYNLLYNNTDDNDERRYSYKEEFTDANNAYHEWLGHYFFLQKKYYKAKNEFKKMSVPEEKAIACCYLKIAQNFLKKGNFKKYKKMITNALVRLEWNSEGDTYRFKKNGRFKKGAKYGEVEVDDYGNDTSSYSGSWSITKKGKIELKIGFDDYGYRIIYRHYNVLFEIKLTDGYEILYGEIPSE